MRLCSVHQHITLYWIYTCITPLLKNFICNLHIHVNSPWTVFTATSFGFFIFLSFSCALYTTPNEPEVNSDNCHCWDADLLGMKILKIDDNSKYWSCNVRHMFKNLLYHDDPAITHSNLLHQYYTYSWTTQRSQIRGAICEILMNLPKHLGLRPCTPHYFVASIKAGSNCWPHLST